MAIFEAVEIPIPANTEENILRGTEAMKKVISTHLIVEKAMYRSQLGWISFPWGRPGNKPPVYKTDKEMLTWWNNLYDKKATFTGGYGISHIIAKRDWEGKWIKGLLGQKGEELALSLVKVIAQGKITREGNKATIVYNPTQMKVGLEKHMLNQKDENDYWVLTGMKIIPPKDYKLILESAVEHNGSDDPSAGLRALYSQVDGGSSFFETGGRIMPTHSVPTLPRHRVGAANSTRKIIQQTPPTCKRYIPPKYGTAEYGLMIRL